jgi:hypothetical protein
MSIDATVKIFGIQQTLKELNDFDKTYRKQVTKDIRKAGDPIVKEAREAVQHFENSADNGAPLSRMYKYSLIKGRSVFWTTSKVQAGFITKVGKRGNKAKTVMFKDKFDAENNPRESHFVSFKATPYELMAMQQKDIAGAIFEHAGKNNTTKFTETLNKEEGPAPRVLEKAVEKNRENVVNGVEKIIDKVMKTLNKKMVVEHGN